MVIQQTRSVKVATSTYMLSQVGFRLTILKLAYKIVASDVSFVVKTVTLTFKGPSLQGIDIFINCYPLVFYRL
jgi:hypothetical protein